ncbi:MAG TPA: glycosyl hydrolase family 18 protein [Candidatus Angelobacter sp.]|nr:glycosyl hydrolase family 18 protein [Candidatus Angelobacter sp.]
MTKRSFARLSRAVCFALCASLLALAPQGTLAFAQDHDRDRDHGRDNDRDSRVIATYYQNFHVFSGTFPRRLADNGVASKLNLLIYAFIDIRADQNGNPHCAAFDEFADYQFFFDQTRSVDGSVDSFAPGALRGQVHQLQELKKQFPNMKILASIGGFSAGVNGFEAASATPASRKAFVADCINSYINGNFSNTTGLAPIFDTGFSEQPLISPPITPTPGIFDGFDIDWEFPTQPQDRANFVALLKEFRQQLDAGGSGHLLTAALPAGEQNFSFIDLPGAARQLDFVNLETFDYAGAFSNHTGFSAPLFQTQFDPNPNLNANFTVQSYLEAGVPSHKILMGIPFFDTGWAITGPSAAGQNGQFVAAINPNAPDSGNPPNLSGTLGPLLDPALASVVATEPHSFVQLHVLQFAQIFHDPPAQTPFAFDGLNFWTFEDTQSLKAKTKFIRENRLGGAFIFEEPDELPDGALFKTILHGLR